MPITRKRKAASTDAGKQSTIASQKTINTFGRVTKSQKADQSVKKRKILDTVAIDTLSSPTRDTTDEDNTIQKEQEGTVRTTQSKKRSRETDEEVTTPQNKRFRDALPPTPAETPSKSASKLFERLLLDHAAPASSVATEEAVYDTPPLTSRAFKSLGSSLPTTELPAQLQELTRLFKAFLASTSLHCAHNGLGTPMYITNLLPHITRSWKKRAVTEHDMSIILGILGDNDTFELADNGEGSLCIELLETNTSTTGHFNQPELIQSFHNRLTTLWNQWVSSSPTARSNLDAFLSQLPTVNIITSQVAPSTNAHLTKGSERLQETLSCNRLKSPPLQSPAAVPVYSTASQPNKQQTPTRPPDPILHILLVYPLSIASQISSRCLTSSPMAAHERVSLPKSCFRIYRIHCAVLSLRRRDRSAWKLWLKRLRRVLLKLLGQGVWMLLLLLEVVSLDLRS
jgi:hypothetical protein